MHGANRLFLYQPQRAGVVQRSVALQVTFRNQVGQNLSVQPSLQMGLLPRRGGGVRSTS